MSGLNHFFSTNAGFAATFSAIATITATFLAHFLRGKVRLIWFSPNSTYFKIKTGNADNPFIHLNSGQIIIQNFGRQSAKDIQITSVPGEPPAGYVILPSIVHSTRAGPNGEWIVEIPYIASNEVVNIQILNGPKIDSVRSNEGAGKLVPVIHQRVFPKSIQLFIAMLMLFGLLSIFYILGWILFRA